MPNTLYTFSYNQASMRWKEPYVSAGVNKRNATVVAPGIYRGFNLTNAVANNTITIVADSVHGDHVAEYLNTAGYSIAIHKLDGDFIPTVLPTVAWDVTYVIALYVDYAISGTTTTSSIKSYTLSPVDEFTGVADIIVLGTVVVPAGSAQIPLANISYTKRMSAWQALAPESVQWTPILRNGSFELGNSTAVTNAYGTVAYWTCSSTNALGYWTGADTNSHSGKYCLSLKLDGTIGGGGFAPVLTQQVNYPVTAGKKVKIKLWKRSLVLASAGTMNISVTFYDNVGSSVTTLAVPMGSVDGSYQLIELETIVPTGYTVLGQVSLQGSGLTYGGGGYPQVVLRLDDIQVWVENQDLMAPGSLERSNQPIFTNRLSIADGVSPTDIFPDAAMMSYTSGSLAISKQDGTALSASLNGNLLPTTTGQDLGDNGHKWDGFINDLSVVQSITDILPSTATGKKLGDSTHKWDVTARNVVLTDITNDASSGTFTLLWEGNTGAGIPAARIYSTPAGNIAQTVNAKWGSPTPNNWNSDDAALQSTIAYQINYTWTFAHQIGGIGGSWAGGAWNNNPIVLIGSSTDPLAWVNKLSVGNGLGPAGKTNPVNTDGLTNTLVAKNIVKGWAVINGYGGGVAPSIIEGFNIDAVSWQNTNGADDTVRVHLVSAMADTNYCCVVTGVTCANVGGFLTTTNYVATPQDTHNIDIRGFTSILNADPSGGFQAMIFSDPAHGQPKFNIIVMGKQT
jgi:hypothetical protein